MKKNTRMLNILALLLLGITFSMLSPEDAAIADGEVPNVDTYAPSLSPTKVTTNIPVSFSIGVVNLGTANVTLDNGTTLSYTDGVSTYTVALSLPVEVPTSSSPDYIVATLSFESAPLPAGFAEGTYPSNLHVSGTDSLSNPYTTDIVSPGNTLWVVTTPPTSPVTVATAWLNPNKVFPGEPLAFTINLNNPNPMDITLDSNSLLSVDDGNGHAYTSTLSDSIQLVTNTSTQVNFQLASLDMDFATGTIEVDLNLSGLDMRLQPYSQTLTSAATVTVLTNMPGLEEVSGSLQPTDPDLKIVQNFQVSVKNTTPCTITLNTYSQALLNAPAGKLFSGYLLATYETSIFDLSLEPGEEELLYFGNPSTEYISFVPGTYHPVFHFIGTSQCDGSNFSAYLSSAGTTTLHADVYTAGFASGMGSYPYIGDYELTQQGGVIGQCFFTSQPAPYQRHIVAATGFGNYYDTLGAHADETILEDLPAFVFIRGQEVKCFPVRIHPDPAWEDGKAIEIERQFHSCGGGMFCTWMSYEHHIFYRPSDGEVEFQAIQPVNTFIARGAANSMQINYSNDQITALQVTSSQLRFDHLGTDISAYFTISPPASLPVLPKAGVNSLSQNFSPSIDAPLGITQIANTTASQGDYPFNVGYRIPAEPLTVRIDGERDSEDNGIIGQMYVVEQLPLALQADDLNLAGRDQAVLPVTVTVKNNSELGFSIVPTSSLTVNFEPFINLALDTEVGAYQSQFATNFTQSFIVHEPTRLGTVTIQSEVCFGGDVEAVIKSQVDPSTIFKKVYFTAPNGACSSITTPSFDFDLLPDHPYQFELNRTTTALELLYGTSDTYSEGTASYVWIGVTYPLPGDLDMQFYSHPLPAVYTASLIISTPILLDPHQSAVLEFVNPIPMTNPKADGIYLPDLLLQGEFSDAAKSTYNFHQHLDTQIDPIYVDNLPPTATFETLPAYSPPQFTLHWQGEDAVTGISTYDLQTQIDEGEWTDWLSNSTSTSATYTGTIGHSYSFRLRARDRAGNESNWSVPVSTTIDNTAPEVTVLSPGGWRSSDYLFEWLAVDPESGIASYDVQVKQDDGEWTDWLVDFPATSTIHTGQDERQYAFRVRATNGMGIDSNWSDPLLTTVDITEPEVTIQPLPTWVTGAFSVSWVGNDTTSGIGSYTLQYSMDNGTIWQNWHENTTLTVDIFTPQDQTRYLFRARAVDLAGNLGSWSNIISIGADFLPPETVLELNAWNKPNFTVSWSGLDYSGIQSWDIQYRLAGEGWTNWMIATTTTSGQFSGVEGQTIEFRLRAQDQAGLTSNWKTKSTSLDGTPPIVSVIPLPAYIPATFTVHWSSTDNLSGVIDYWVRIYDHAAATVVYENDHYLDTSIQYTGEHGKYYFIFVYAKDAAGNQTPPNEYGTVTFGKIDALSPTVSIIPAPPTQNTLCATYSWFGQDSDSGIDYYHYQVRKENGNWDFAEGTTASPSVDICLQDDYEFFVRVQSVDQVGNLSDWSQTSTTVDVTTWFIYLPTITR